MKEEGDEGSTAMGDEYDDEYRGWCWCWCRKASGTASGGRFSFSLLSYPSLLLFAVVVVAAALPFSSLGLLPAVSTVFTAADRFSPNCTRGGVEFVGYPPRRLTLLCAGSRSSPRGIASGVSGRCLIVGRREVISGARYTLREAAAAGDVSSSAPSSDVFLSWPTLCLTVGIARLTLRTWAAGLSRRAPEEYSSPALIVRGPWKAETAEALGRGRATLSVHGLVIDMRAGPWQMLPVEILDENPVARGTLLGLELRKTAPLCVAGRTVGGRLS